MLLAFFFPLKRKRKQRKIKGRKEKEKPKRLSMNLDLRPTELQVPSEHLSPAQLTWPGERFPTPR